MKITSLVLALTLGLSFASLAETTVVTCKSGQNVLTIEYRDVELGFPDVRVQIEKNGKIVGKYFGFPTDSYGVFFSTTAKERITMDEEQVKLLDRVLMINPEKPHNAMLFAAPAGGFNQEADPTQGKPLMTFKSCNLPE